MAPIRVPKRCAAWSAKDTMSAWAGDQSPSSPTGRGPGERRDRLVAIQSKADATDGQ